MKWQCLLTMVFQIVPEFVSYPLSINLAFNAVPSEELKVRGIQCQPSSFHLTYKYFSRFSNSFHHINLCRWWNPQNLCSRALNNVLKLLLVGLFPTLLFIKRGMSLHACEGLSLFSHDTFTCYEISFLHVENNQALFSILYLSQSSVAFS